MKEHSDGSRRAAFGLLLGAVAIVLMERAAIANVQVGPFEISDLSLVRKRLPMLTAYLIYDLTYTGFRYVGCRRVATQIDYKYRPGMFHTRMAALSYPQLSSLLGPLPWHRRQGLSFRLVLVFALVLRGAGVLFAVLLEGIWVGQPFATFGPGDVLVWISAGLSTCFLSFAAVLAWEGFKSGHFRGSAGHP